MNLRIPLAVAMIAIAGTLTSCTVGNHNPPPSDTGVGNNPTGAPAETATSEPTEEAASEPSAEALPEPAEVLPPETVEMTLPPEAGSAGPEAVAPFPDGAPIPDSELEGSRTAAHLRFLAARLDAYLAANGVPADWELNGFSYIAVTYTTAESDAWDDDIGSGFRGKPDGSYYLSGSSENGADPKFEGINNTLSYVSGKGFVENYIPY